MRTEITSVRLGQLNHNIKKIKLIAKKAFVLMNHLNHLGASSVVLKNISADSLAVGNPARVIRKLNQFEDKKSQ